MRFAPALLLLLAACSDEPAKDHPAPKGPEQVLDVESVRAYLEIAPRVHDILARSATDGSITTPEGGAANRAKIEGLLRRHGYGWDSWTRVRKRVEHMVSMMRAEKRRPEDIEELDRQIAVKEAALEGAGDAMRKRLEQDLEKLRAMKSARIEIHEADRAILQRFWTDLDRVAPHVR